MRKNSRVGSRRRDVDQMPRRDLISAEPICATPNVIVIVKRVESKRVGASLVSEPATESQTTRKGDMGRLGNEF